MRRADLLTLNRYFSIDGKIGITPEIRDSHRQLPATLRREVSELLREHSCRGCFPEICTVVSYLFDKKRRSDIYEKIGDVDRKLYEQTREVEALEALDFENINVITFQSENQTKAVKIRTKGMLDTILNAIRNDFSYNGIVLLNNSREGMNLKEWIAALTAVGHIGDVHEFMVRTASAMEGFLKNNSNIAGSNKRAELIWDLFELAKFWTIDDYDADKDGYKDRRDNKIQRVKSFLDQSKRRMK